jgi:cytochrome c-type biogenesis protein CcmE
VRFFCGSGFPAAIQTVKIQTLEEKKDERRVRLRLGCQSDHMVRHRLVSIHFGQKNQKTGKNLRGCIKMKKSYVIGGVVIVLAMVMAMYSFQSTLTSYVTVSEAKASNRAVQVAGIVVEGTDRYDLTSNNLLFTLREDSGEEMKVEYDGPRPGNFDNVTKVVAIGKYEPKRKVFLARELLVKCPTKYEGRVQGE